MLNGATVIDHIAHSTSHAAITNNNANKAMHKSKQHCIMDSGLVLIDTSLNVIAHDRGAEEIVNSCTTQILNGSLCLPAVMSDLICPEMLDTLSPVKRMISLGNRQYICCIYALGLPETAGYTPIIAVHLLRHRAVIDAMDEVSHAYHLTQREQEVLIGLSSTGLTNKELAERLNVSPNTIKLFVRLMMMKMGVNTRAGLITKVMERRPSEPLALEQAL